jgi:hypothetical protein
MWFPRQSCSPELPVATRRWLPMHPWFLLRSLLLSMIAKQRAKARARWHRAFVGCPFLDGPHRVSRGRWRVGRTRRTPEYPATN